MTAVYYFGCWGAPGHMLWRPNRTSLSHRTEPFLSLGRSLDGGFCPGGVHASTREQEEGATRLHHIAGWTVLSFWDRSGDRRHGSHSTFLVEGAHDFTATVALAREHFPDVLDRITRAGIEIRLAEGDQP